MEKPDERKLLAEVLETLATDTRADVPSRTPEATTLRLSKCRARGDLVSTPREQLRAVPRAEVLSFLLIPRRCKGLEHRLLPEVDASGPLSTLPKALT